MNSTSKTVQIDSITANQFFSRLDQLEQTIKSINAKPHQKEIDKFLTRTQVADQLQVSKQTLIVWQRKKVLIGSRIGTRIRYKQSDVDQLMSSNLKTV
jgi:excisionase family DNA binding protein